MPKDPSKSPLKLCKCTSCAEYKCTDKNGRPVRGMWVSRHTYTQHHRNRAGQEEGGGMDGVEGAAFRATLGETPTAPGGSGLFNSHRVPSPEAQQDGEGIQGRGGIQDGEDIQGEEGIQDGEGIQEGNGQNGGGADADSDLRIELREWGKRLQDAKEAFYARPENTSAIHFDHVDHVDLATIPPLHHVGSGELLKYQAFLNRLREHLASLCAGGNLEAVRASMTGEIDREILALRGAIARAWEARKVQLNNPGPARVTTIQKAKRGAQHATAKIVFAYMATAVCMALMDNVSRNSTSFLLTMMRALLTACCLRYARHCSGGSEEEFADPLTTLGEGHAWPTDIRTAIEALEIDPETVVMACCKSCRAIYEPSQEQGARYPATCTNRAFPWEQPCGAKLVKDGSNRATPLHPFLYQRMETWLNRMLSRRVIVEGMQEMSRSWARGAVRITDMIFAKALRELLGPDGRSFMAAPNGELRLAFTLNVDWFNPFGRRTAGKHASVGGVYMVCMSLPIHLRYRVENIYLVGIIPGPSEPDVHQMNHVLRPLVDSLLRFWHVGVRFAWTACHPTGCRVRVAVAALICDIPAMRKVAGFAGHSANLFCSFCKLLRSQVANLDKATWPSRTRQGHMEAAKRYKEAPDKKTRDKEFEENGVRWSELLRLPYWNPLEFSVVDSMHNLFLNNCKQHCRVIWGMDGGSGSNKKMAPHSSAMQAGEIEKVKRAIEKGEKNAMTKARKSYIEAFVELNNVRITSKKATKADLAEALKQWRTRNRDAEVACPEPLPYPIYNFPLPGKRETILNAPVLAEIVKDIGRTSLPNWISAPTKNLGTKKQGKLSADQWRTVCTVSLVITLGRLWGRGAPQSLSKRWLDNFLELVTVIRFATRRSVSPESIAVVEERLGVYLHGLVELFGADVLTLNHHLSLHLPEFLHRLGPVHGWWTFAFERYNGIIQRFNTNNKFGELESTFMRTFCRGGNLRAMMAELPDVDDGEDVEGVLHALKTAFHQAFSAQFKGTLKADLLAMGADGRLESQDLWVVDHEEHLIPEDIYQKVSARIETVSPHAIHNRRCQLSKRLKFRGVEFTTKRESKGNAQVIFRAPSADGTTVDAAGEIDGIFRHKYREVDSGREVVQTLFTLRRYAELEGEDVSRDPYRQYSRLDVRLCYNKFENEHYIVTKEDLVSHLATCPIVVDETTFVVVLNLSRD